MYTGIFLDRGESLFLPLCAYCTGLSASLVLSVPPMDYRAHSRSTHNAGTRSTTNRNVHFWAISRVNVHYTPALAHRLSNAYVPRM